MTNKEKTETEIKVQDANNFYCQLLKKINSCYDKKNHVVCQKTKKYDSEECECKINDKEVYESGKCKRKRNRTKGCLSEGTDEEICDGKKIKRYLDCLIPEWEDMRATRLYKHIQKMHENAEIIRRFEIDLTWRRALYFIPLIVIFFTAFGGAFLFFQSEFGTIYNNKIIDTHITINQDGTIISGRVAGYIISDYSEEGNINNNSPVYKSESKVGHWALLAIAFINACLCFFLTKMNVESQRWQRNWERHIDYLQQILGFKLMQTCLRPRGRYFTIRKTNTLISSFAFLVWYFLVVLLFVLIFSIDFIFHPECDVFSDYNFFFCVYNHVWLIALLAAPIFISDIYYCLTGEYLFAENEKELVSGNNSFYIRKLKIALDNDYLKDQPSNSKNKNRTLFYATYIIIFSIPFIFVIMAHFIVNYSNIVFSFILIMMMLIFIPFISRYFTDAMKRVSADTTKGITK